MACDTCVDLILPDPRLVEPVSVSSTTFGAVTSSSFAFHHNPLLRSCGTVTSGVTVPPKASEPFYENILFLLFYLLAVFIWMEGLAKLQASRKAFRSHLTRTYNKMDELDFTQPATEEIASQVTSYIDQLQRKAESIRQLNSKISAEIRDNEDLEREVYEAEEIQDSIIEKSTRLKRYLEAQHKSNRVTTTTPNIREPPQSTLVPATVPSTSTSRLPKLSLPTFSGNPLLWQTFWDLFEAAVHGNPNLTGVEKFNYLRAQLESEAARIVGGFPLTNANYEQTISLLKTRFGKQQRIVNAHMRPYWICKLLPIPQSVYGNC